MCNFYSRAEIEKSIRAQVAAEEKAHKVVEELVLEEVITEDCLKNAVSVADVSIPEYVISRDCGANFVFGWHEPFSAEGASKMLLWGSGNVLL